MLVAKFHVPQIFSNEKTHSLQGDCMFEYRIIVASSEQIWGLKQFYDTQSNLIKIYCVDYISNDKYSVHCMVVIMAANFVRGILDLSVFHCIAY